MNTQCSFTPPRLNTPGQKRESKLASLLKAVASTGAKDVTENPLAQQYRWFLTVR